MSARELAVLVVEALNLQELDPATVDLIVPPFGDGLGLDSLDMLEISLIIQQRYGVKLKGGRSEQRGHLRIAAEPGQQDRTVTR